ncbi:MAG: Gfo/Idh/MocA family protein [bacterium]
MRSVRIGVVGVGLVGKRHVGAIARAVGVEIAGVVEPNPQEADFVGEHGLTNHPSVASLLSNSKPDGVVIATPTSVHIEQALECVAHGCPVLIEKPIALHADDARALIERAERDRVAVLVGHHRRHNPLIKRAHEMIQSGDLGTVRAVHGSCWFYKPDEYFDVAPWRKRKGAGIVSVNLVHDIDLLRHLVGEIVSVQSLTTPSARGYENEDVVVALLRFADGAVGTITASDSIAAPWSWEHTAHEYPIYPATPENCYLIGGSNASLSLPDLRLWSHAGGAPDWWSPISATCQVRESSDPLVNQIAHFAQVINGGAEPLVSAREAVLTLRVIEAMQRSARSGEATAITA